jgi:hypothetical protein
MAQIMTGARPINPTAHAARVALLQAAQPLWARGYDRETGERVYLVPSQTEAGKYHRVTTDGCDCRSWQYRGACAHHGAVAAMMSARR